MAYAVSLLSQSYLPHFWDEAWVYSPAIKSMAGGDLSIFPNAIPLELSRGHPLLYHFLAATWVKLLGESNLVLHAFAIALSILTLLAVFSLVESVLKNRWVAVSTVLLVMSQPMFITQSFMVYPEMLLTLTLILALIFYYHEKVRLFQLCLVGLFLTKESGLVYVLAFITVDLLVAI